MTSIDRQSFAQEHPARKVRDLVALLRGRAEETPSATAYVFLKDGEREGARLSFSDLDRRARSIAAHLQSLDMAGERALLLYPPGLDYIEAFFGCLYAGVTAVPAYPPSGRHLQRLQAICRDASPRTIMTTGALHDKFGAEAARALGGGTRASFATDRLNAGEARNWRPIAVDPDDLAFLQYTSGSTGDPRGVMVSHANLIVNQELIKRSFQHDEHSTLVGWLPLYHDMGLIGNILQPLYVGSTAYLMSPLAFLEKPLRWLQAISTYRARTSGGPNFAFDLCVRKITAEERRNLDLSEWSIAFSGAEPVRAATLDRFASAFADCGFRRESFFPCYGLAEATLVVTAPTRDKSVVLRRVARTELQENRIEDAATEADIALVGCGHSWLGHEVVIVAPDTGRPCATREVGEIWVAGPSVARGYWGRPEDTERVFRAQLDVESDKRFMRTGDLGFLDGGELFITGRSKDLIIIAGRNYYPQDFESVADEVEGLRPGCCAAFSVTIGEREEFVIIAEPHRSLLPSLLEGGARDLFQKFRERLADHVDIAPAEIILAQPGSVPKTSSGKIRRAECRRNYLDGELQILARSGHEGGSAGALGEEGAHKSVDKSALLLRDALSFLPRPQKIELITRFLVSNAAELLRIPENELTGETLITRSGLDSLRIVELKHALDALLGAEVPLAILLSEQTFRQLAESVCDVTPNAGASFPTAVASDVDRRLSHSQLAMWAVHQLDASSIAYNLHLALDIDGSIDFRRMKHVLAMLVDRHEQLRTLYRAEQGGPVQTPVALADLPPWLHEIDAETWDAAELRADLERRAALPFDLEREAPLRVTFYRRDADHVTLLFGAHHIAVDLWSLLIFLKQLDEAYRSRPSGPSFELPHGPRYAAFCAAQDDYLSTPAAERDWAYWSARLGGTLPLLELPTDFQRPAVPGYGGASESSRVSATSTARLTSLAKRQGVSLFSLLLAVYFVLLHRHTGQAEMIVGVPTSGRLRADFAGLIGNCVNPIALRERLKSTESFTHLLRRVHESVKEALEHQKFPFPLVVERLQPERHGSHWPIYQTWFVLQQAQSNMPEGFAALALGEAGEPFPLLGGSAKSVGLRERVQNFDLELMAAMVGGEIHLSFQYRKELFAPSTIERLGRRYRALLDGVAADPDSLIGDLPMLDEDERRRIIVDWNATSSAYRQDACLHELFEAQVVRSPDSVAIVFANERLVYRELNARANQLAHRLAKEGVGPDSLVGVCAERSLEMVVGLLGILKAGGAYLPLDPDYPRERLAYMIADARPSLVLTQDHLRERLPDDTSTLRLDADWESIATESDGELGRRATPQNLAYVIYTSGSTGQPKGVAVAHGGVVNRIEWMQSDYRLTEDDVVLQKTPFGFDVSVWEFFWPLQTGARLVLAGPGDHREPARLTEIIAREQVTTLHFVPSMLQAFLLAPDCSALKSLRRVLSSGEELSPRLRDRFHASLSADLHNLYGPTEASIDVTAHACRRDSDDAIVPIGRPIWNTQLYILDGGSNPVPIGVVGELHIGGVGLARGYLECPDLTAERFVPNPFGAAGERLYRTGDLARYRADGSIVFLGRLDHQVKIRGYRIELGEVEAALARFAGVREVVVAAREDAPGEKRLVAYLVGETGAELAASTLRSALAHDLPDYMVPSLFVVVDALPLTTSGKVDRKALPAPDIEAQAQSRYVAPHTPVEETLCRIWADVLGLQRVGVEDEFFELGGDSIRAIQVAVRMRNSGFDLTPRQLFQYPTPAKLAPYLSLRDPEAPPKEVDSVDSLNRSFSLADLEAGEIASIARRHADIEDIYPLTPMQEGMLFHALSQSGAGVYHMQEQYEIKGAVDVEAFAEAWRCVIDRHSALRTSFEWNLDGRAHQLVHRRASLPFEYIDFRSLPGDQHEAQIGRLLKAELQKGFDLSVAPLMRIHLIRIEDERYVCVRSFHHIIMDDWCTSPLLMDVRRHYAALVNRLPVSAQRAGRFRNYIEWLRRQDLGTAERFWRSYLDGFTDPTPLVIARNAESGAEASGAVDDVVVELSAADFARLQNLAREHHLTVNTFVQGALALLLCRYAGTNETVFGVTVSGRPMDLPDVETTIGLFINSLPLRVRIRPDKPILEWLKELLADNLEIRQYEYVSQSMVQRWSAVARADALLFQHLLTFENAPIDPSLRGEKDVLDIDLRELRVHTNYPITFVAIPGGALTLRLTYVRDRFDAEDIRRMAGRLKSLIEGLIRNCDGLIGDVEFSSDAERQRVLVDWNRTAHTFAEPLDIVGRFEAQVERRPDAIAASCGGAALSYRALNERVNNVAHALIVGGLGPDNIVALLDERGVDFLVMMLAVFKSGSGYLPLDPAYPDGRIARVLEGARVDLVLVGAGQGERAETITAALDEACCPPIVELASLEMHDASHVNPRHRHDPSNLAFVISTSGSTGAPKGAIVEHRGMFNNLITKEAALELTTDDVIAQTASQAFDISVWQFLTALALGARIEIFPDEISRDPPRLLKEIARRGVTILEAVPSMIRALLDASETGKELSGLRWLMPCGEAFAPELCRRFMERYPNIRLLNAYGPAECSDDVTYYPIDRPPEGDDLSVPIGRPVDNTQIYLLDRWLDVAPVGVPAEICVAGVQVGRGYLHRPDLTAAAFVPNPFDPDGTRLYRTGDLGRYRADGVVEFLGRVDHQVKIRGHRIEPGEVESRLVAHPDIRQACVVAREVSKGAYRLAAYLVSESDILDFDELRRHLCALLPDYMVPSVFIRVDALPLTPNGKVDRRALPDPDFVSQSGRYVAPQNAVEEMIAKIWTDVLGVGRVGITDNFFELGGHSLLVTRIASRIRSAFAVDPPLRTLFEAHTVAEMAEVVQAWTLVRDNAAREGSALQHYEDIAL